MIGDVILLFAMLGCTPEAEVEPAEEAGPTLQCTVGDADVSAIAARPGDHGTSYRVVELPSEAFDTLVVAVTYPPDGVGAYDEGAPVVVVAAPSLGAQPPWPEAPVYFPAAHGIVGVVPLYSGFGVRDQVTSGTFDDGGPGTRTALREAIRFAAGELETVDGHGIDDLTDGPVCTGSVVLMGTSSGAMTALWALAEHDELEPLVAGYVAYENPVLPQLLTADTGIALADPDREVDADGDGYAWDDARNLSVSDTGCTTDGCPADLSAIAWTDDANQFDVYGGFFGPSEHDGVLYLDRNGNAQFDLALDIDGDGRVGLDEDFPLLPHRAADRDYYSPSVATAAAALDLPEHVATPAETESWWADRDPARALELLDVPDGFVVDLCYSYVSHASAFPTRPNQRLLHEHFDAAGAAVRYQPSLEASRCAIPDDQLGDFAGGAEPGVALSPDDVARLAYPETVDRTYVRAAAAVQVLTDVWGAPDHCAEP